MEHNYWEQWEIDQLKEWHKEKNSHDNIDESDGIEEILEQLPPSRLEGVIGRMSGIMGNAPRIANDILIHLLTQEKKEITEGSDYFSNNNQLVKAKHDYIIDRLQKMPYINRIYYPDACVNITVQINHPYFDDDMKLAVELMKHGTLIMPTSGYGYNPSQTILRITFFERERQLKHSMDALEQVLSTT